MAPRRSTPGAAALALAGAALLRPAAAAFGSRSRDSTTPFPTSYNPAAAQTGAYGSYGAGMVAGAMPAGTQLVPGTRLVTLSDEAAKIIGGITEAFLGGEHGVLSPSELQCLSDGAGKLTAGVMDTAGRTAQTMHLFVNQAKGSALQANMAAAATGMPVNPGASNVVDPIIAGLEISQRISSMMEFEEKIAKKCLKKDATAQLRAAAHHLGNITFLSSRLVSNGVDIVTELAKATNAFDSAEYRVFGDNVGLAARKVLLSKRGLGLAELNIHEPTAEECQEVTSGLVSSLFGRGMRMDVFTDPITTWAPPPPMYYPQMTSAPGPNGTVQMAPSAPTMVPWTLLPATEVNVDLHQCIAGNKDLFKSAWTPVWQIMNKMATSSVAEGLDSVEKATGEGAEGFGALAMSMLDTQIALRRCGFTAEQEAILWDSMEAGQGFHTKFDVPGAHDLTKSEVTANMGFAVDSWKKKRYEDFGKRLGVTMRELMMQTFPEKYYVDGDGLLRKRLLQLSDAQGARAELGGAIGLRAPLAAACAALLVAGLVVVRTRHAYRYASVTTEAPVRCREETVDPMLSV